MKDNAALTTATHWPDSAKYVGFNARMGASFIDSIALLLPLSLLLELIFGSVWQKPAIQPEQIGMISRAQTHEEAYHLAMETVFSGARFGQWLVENGVSGIITGAVIIAMWHWFSATPGKMLMGMKIVDEKTGLPTTFQQDVIRYIGYFVATIPLCVGLIWVIFDKRSQGWHDKMAGTVVVYKKSLPPELAEATRKNTQAGK